MEIELWDRKTNFFKGILDDIYANLSHCEVYFIKNKGFVVLNRKPKYSLYQKLGIPEIQDVFVFPDYRRQGLATALIRFCEEKAGTDMIGISVPISHRYGGAQRLYSRLGYIPDGNGVTYNREIINHNSGVKVDDDLCLMLVKDLK
jgi:GNAT superfamily N-acetyltransferase